MVRYSPESQKFPPNAALPHIERKEKAFARSFLGADFYQTLLGDLVDTSGMQAWSPAKVYTTGNIVDYFGMALKSLEASNSVNPCEDIAGESWEAVKKFTSDCYETMWAEGLRDYLAYTVMASAIDHTTFPASAKGVGEWVDDASGLRSASYSIFVARKNKLLSDASEALENLRDWMYRKHSEGECDFSGVLWLQGCSTKPKAHRGRRFHFAGRLDTRRVAGKIVQPEQYLPYSLVQVSGSASFVVSAGKVLEYIVCESGSSGAAKVGTTSGGSEIAEGNISAGVPLQFNVFQYYAQDQTIYFTGTFGAKVYIRK